MEYNYQNLVRLIKDFCASHDSNCSFFESDDLSGQAIFDFDECLLGASFGEIDWGPYYMASIEVRAFDDTVPASHKSGDLVYFFYDSRDNSLEDIENALNEAYQYASVYNKSKLSARINKDCSLVENWRLGLHPDDEDYSECGAETYKCVGTFAQYYVLSDGQSEFRVLEKYIRWI